MNDRIRPAVEMAFSVFSNVAYELVDEGIFPSIDYAITHSNGKLRVMCKMECQETIKHIAGVHKVLVNEWYTY